eukprot:15270277-Alexandrium_andersonii.AAC.1
MDNLKSAKQFVELALDSVIQYDQLNESVAGCVGMWTKIVARGVELRGGTTHEKTESQWARWENTARTNLNRKKVQEIKNELVNKYAVVADDLADLNKDNLVVMAVQRMRAKQQETDDELVASWRGKVKLVLSPSAAGAEGQ